MDVTFTGPQLREIFLRWLDGEPTGLPFSLIQPALAQMDDAPMPQDACRRHGFAVGCSVGHSARSLICLLGPDGREYLIDGLIAFANENESSEWWRHNRDNPDRIVLKPNGKGGHELRIAPIQPEIAS